MEESNNLFRNYVDFVNNLEPGEKFTRNQIKKLFDDNPSIPTTLDTYRRTLEAAGYTRKGTERGVYVKVRDVPKHLSLRDVRALAYPQEFTVKKERRPKFWDKIKSCLFFLR